MTRSKKQKYLCKNIVLYENFGSWYADYNEDGNRFAIARTAERTRKMAYKVARDQVNYMNSQERRQDERRKHFNL